MRAQFAVVLLALVWSGVARSESLPDHCTILPTSEGSALIRQRSRGSPTNVSGFWTPSPEQVIAIEKLLPELLRKNHLKSKISDSYRQYVGIISSGRRLIYLNSIPHERPDWRIKAIIIFDGGEAYWGVEFDPANNSFHNLESNGWA